MVSCAETQVIGCIGNGNIVACVEQKCAPDFTACLSSTCN
jgi:hypothetical protein